MATTNVGNLVVKLLGDGSSYQKMLKKAEAATRRVGIALTAAFTAPIALSLKTFSDFDKAMTESTSIMKTTEAQVKSMRQTALNLSGTVAQGPAELAKAYFFLASAGFDAEQAIAALPSVTAFATAGTFDLAQATDLLTDAQSSLGLVSKDTTKNMTNMNRVSDVLVKANTLANASVSQFSTALTSKAGAALKSFNKDVEEGVAVLAAMADQGIKAELAGNNLSRIILLLSKASADNKKDFERLGFSVFDAQGKMRNFADIVKNLEVVLKGMSDQEKAATLTSLGFEARIQGAILPLIGTSAAIKDYEKALRNAGGTTQEVADKQMKSFSNQLKITVNQVKAIAISVGEVLAPFVLQLNGALKKAAGAWNRLSPSMKRATILAAGFLAALGPMLIAVSALLPALGAVGGLITAMVGPVGLVVAGIAAAVGALVHFTVGWENAGNQLRAFGKNALGFMVNFRDNMTTLFNWLKTNWELFRNNTSKVLIQVAKNIGSNIAVAINTLFRLWTAWQGFMVGMFKRVFSVEFMKWVLKGLIRTGKAIVGWAGKIGKVVASVFSPKNRTKAISGVGEFLDDLSNQIAGDFAGGGDNFAGQVKTILSEQFSKLGGTFENTGLFTEAPKFKFGFGEQVAKEVKAETPKMEAAAIEVKNKLEEKLTIKPKFDMSGIQAARRGSAEAAARISQFRANAPGVAKPKVNEGARAKDKDGSKKQENLLRRIDGHLNRLVQLGIENASIDGITLTPVGANA